LNLNRSDHERLAGVVSADIHLQARVGGHGHEAALLQEASGERASVEVDVHGIADRVVLDGVGNGEAVVLEDERILRVLWPHGLPVDAGTTGDVARTVQVWQRGDVADAVALCWWISVIAFWVNAVFLPCVVHWYPRAEVLRVVGGEAEYEVVERVGSRGDGRRVDGQLDGGGLCWVEAPGVVQDDDELPRVL